MAGFTAAPIHSCRLVLLFYLSLLRGYALSREHKTSLFPHKFLLQFLKTTILGKKSLYESKYIDTTTNYNNDENSSLIFLFLFYSVFKEIYQINKRKLPFKGPHV